MTASTSTRSTVCESCQVRRAVAVIGLPGGDRADLCGDCLDDAVALGLIELTDQLSPAGSAR